MDRQPVMDLRCFPWSNYHDNNTDLNKENIFMVEERGVRRRGWGAWDTRSCFAGEASHLARDANPDATVASATTLASPGAGGAVCGVPGHGHHGSVPPSPVLVPREALMEGLGWRWWVMCACASHKILPGGLHPTLLSLCSSERTPLQSPFCAFFHK